MSEKKWYEFVVHEGDGAHSRDLTDEQGAMILRTLAAHDVGAGNLPKRLNRRELAEIITAAIAGDDGPDEMDTYQHMLEDFAEVVTNYFGGKLRGVDFNGDGGEPDHDIYIDWNDSVPDDEGIYKGKGVVEWAEGMRDRMSKQPRRSDA